MSRTRKGVAAAILAMATAGTAWLIAPHAVKREIQRRAAARGVSLDTGEVKIRAGRIELRNVSVSTSRWPVRPFRIERVTVRTSWFKVTAIEADKASVEIDGDTETLLSKLEDARSGGGSVGPVALSVSRLDVAWRGPCKGEGEAGAGGVAASTEGGLKATAETAMVSCYGVKVYASGVEGTRTTARAKGVDGEGLGVKVHADGVAAGFGANPWVSADSAEATWSGMAARASGLKASATVPVTSVSLEAKLAILNSETIQGGVPVIADLVAATDMVFRFDFAFEVGTSGPNGGHASLKASSLSAAYAAITGQKVTTRTLSVEGDAWWRGRLARPWTLPGWKAKLGDAKASMDAEINDDRFSVTARLGEADGQWIKCGDLLKAVPDGMAPSLDGFEADGDIQAGLSVDKGRDTAVRVSLKNKCKFTKWPDSMAPAALRKKFVRTVYGPSGLPIELESGPGSKGWVPYGQISKFMPAAIQGTEDPGFFRHRGIDVSAVENSIKQDLEAGKFVRGASTVSMQLAKNLWLSRTKTISRKIQEAFLTTYLEQVLTKEEILCLYLNVVEFGPMTYGIGPAARKFFGAEPDELTLGQSLFLASVLPSPKTQWFGPDGKIQEGRMRWLHGVMESMRKAYLLSDGELQDGLSEWLVLGKKPDRKAPDGKIVAGPEGLDPDWNH